MSKSDILLVLPSCRSSIDDLDGFVQDLISSYSLDINLQGCLLTSLTEAVNNAIIHGNELCRNKYVTIEAAHNTTTLELSISDEGTGFDESIIPDPTQPDRLTQEGGRGVFLMKHLCDEMELKNNGSTVVLKFDCFPNKPIESLNNHSVIQS